MLALIEYRSLFAGEIMGILHFASGLECRSQLIGREALALCECMGQWFLIVTHFSVGTIRR